MKNDETFTIQTSDLEVGTTLTFDLTDGSGVVLHKAGTPITKRLLDHLSRNSVTSVKVKGAKTEKLDTDGLLLSFHDPEFVKATDLIVSQTEKALTELCEQLRRGEKGDASEVRPNVESFLSQSIENSSAALAVIASRASKIPTDHIAKIVSRSTLMALMGVTVGVVMKCQSRDCVRIGMAGILHDSSLLLHPEWFSPEVGVRKSLRALAEYKLHPIESAELLSKAEGIDKDVLAAIAQVHEQLDGSGFPNGLSGDAISQAAQVLNVADAYIELTQPLFHSESIIPSDALAYLCHSATAKKFDSQCIKGIILATSLYPIGSLVELNDGVLAVVVSCNPGNPMEPIVKLMTEEKNVVNLADSPRYIARPHLDPTSSAKRIDKTNMDQMLWRSDILRETSL